MPLYIPGVLAKEIAKKRVVKLTVNKHNPIHFPDKNWKDVWPAPSLFNHYTVPIPLRQGYVKNLAENKGIIPDKYANAELMKIPNFLHLTPEYQTEWPIGLNDSNSINWHYPIKTSKKVFVRSTNDKRDSRSIRASLKVKLDRFQLSDSQKLKMLKLCVGPGAGKEYCSYNWSTDELEIFSSRCPTYQQNLDYINYTLNVLIGESLKVDKWETEEIQESDRACYNWETSRELEKLLNMGFKLEDVENNPSLKEYKKAVEDLYSKNSLLHKNIYEDRPEPYIEKKRHRKMRAIYDVPFEPVYECSDMNKLDAYKNSVKKLFQLAV